MVKFSYLQPGKQAVFKDRFVTKVNECLIPYSEGAKGDIGLIGLPFSKTSISLSQASDAPKTIRANLSSFSTFSGEKEKDYKNISIIDFGDVQTHPTDLEESIERLHVSVREMLENNACQRYIMLGGDHGVSFPSIRAFKEHYGEVGVIQWDAHHDVRNLYDGGRTNGTPFRSLIEGGHLKGGNLVQVGIRDYANAKEYHDYTKEKGISVYTMEDIENTGIIPIIKKELERLSELVDVIYLSVDMDVVDQAFAPGCPAIGPGGITSRELLASISAAASHEKVKAMDIVEIDPSKDFRDLTSRLAAASMLRFMYN
ncbi:formimidoylglutamase [Mesobacillus boroniphilus]|uniref:Formimidoylglutamase n=1 Tax=Mesobacillus boroniphilus TaxID=308892 RepID=A0A944CJG1_9BACI|nr:formimidoylglutamase [Mesobacillus boroniphilus]MBS8264390.1 formimidoylglutamase [Mesobacillus boroniphilus]